MRMNPAQPRTAADYVNRSSERDLANLFYQLGEERYSRRIARAVMKARPFRTTTELAQVVTRTVPSRAGLLQFSRDHSSRRSRRLPSRDARFSGAANRREPGIGYPWPPFLKRVPEVLAAGGRFVVISFHSLEDRLVKQAFQAWNLEGSFRLLTRKVVRPGAAEVQSNPRSRSARLRAAEKARAGQVRLNLSIKGTDLNHAFPNLQGGWGKDSNWGLGCGSQSHRLIPIFRGPSTIPALCAHRGSQEAPPLFCISLLRGLRLSGHSGLCPPPIRVSSPAIPDGGAEDPPSHSLGMES